MKSIIKALVFFFILNSCTKMENKKIDLSNLESFKVELQKYYAQEKISKEEQELIVKYLVLKKFKIDSLTTFKDLHSKVLSDYDFIKKLEIIIKEVKEQKLEKGWVELKMTIQVKNNNKFNIKEIQSKFLFKNDTKRTLFTTGDYVIENLASGRIQELLMPYEFHESNLEYIEYKKNPNLLYCEFNTVLVILENREVIEKFW